MKVGFGPLGHNVKIQGNGDDAFVNYEVLELMDIRNEEYHSR